MSRRLVTIRAREDDLRIVIGNAHDWGTTLLDSARTDDGSIDRETERTARGYIAAANRVRAALNAAAEAKT